MMCVCLCHGTEHPGCSGGRRTSRVGNNTLYSYVRPVQNWYFFFFSFHLSTGQLPQNDPHGAPSPPPGHRPAAVATATGDSRNAPAPGDGGDLCDAILRRRRRRRPGPAANVLRELASRGGDEQPARLVQHPRQVPGLRQGLHVRRPAPRWPTRARRTPRGWSSPATEWRCGVFDIDDTVLTNLPFYADTGFGAQPYNATCFDENVANATAPPLPEVLRLYERLLALGIKVVFITGRHDYQTEPTVTNLRTAGYHTWEKLVLKPPSLLGSSEVPFKSGERQKLVDAGYRIVGNMGDQWSDLLGAPEGARTFKVPDPMYYVG